MRLIDIDKSRVDFGIAERCEDCKWGGWKCWNSCRTIRDICDWLRDAQEVDAVKVVRCKDCMFRDDPHKSTTYLPCTEMRTAPNWFCASGKRRG